MKLFKRWWVKVVTFVNVITLSPMSDNMMPQHPLTDLLPSTGEFAAVQGHHKHSAGPIFRPPGTPEDSDFQCDYSAMKGWIPCSNEFDRKCWLYNPFSKKQYDIYTDYENDIPVGITRYYNLDLADGSYGADGVNFTEAKLFNGIYPGPWIEACWGDRWACQTVQKKVEAEPATRLIVNVTNSLKYNGTSVHWHVSLDPQSYMSRFTVLDSQELHHVSLM